MIPTNVMTGFLGVGKTTAVLSLLAAKPAAERWAVLVNEYGEVGIDEAVIAGQGVPGVSVREVGGGCFCCATAPYLPVALHFLLTESRPDRLLVESSGLGHPANLIDTLRRDYADRLTVRATICLVDPADFARPGMTDNPVFADQVQLADVLVMNKLDTASEAQVRDFQAWANGLFPPKALIVGTTHGRLDPAWLDIVSDDRPALFPQAHAHVEQRDQPVQAFPSPGRPVRLPSPGACGWVFSRQDVFDEMKLLGVLAQFPAVTRLKGVFRTADEWVVVNRVGAAVTVAPTAYRRDSRVEAFGDGVDWDGFERGLNEAMGRG
jgi:G3E family GTPase